MVENQAYKKVLVLICFCFSFAVSAPKHGNTPDSTMDSDSKLGTPLAGSHDCKCIKTSDVLTDEESDKDVHYSQVNNQLDILNKSEGGLIDIPKDFLVELADVDKCVENVITLRDCLQDQTKSPGEPIKKLVINTGTATDSQTSEENFIKVCEDEKTGLEECIVDANRYHPCPPPKRNTNKFNELLKERKEKFTLILESHGYNVTRENGYKVSKIDDKYYNYVGEFLSSLGEGTKPKSLPQAFENFRKEFDALEKKVYERDVDIDYLNKFYDFVRTLKIATCMREISNLAEVIADLNAQIKQLADDSTSVQYNSFQKSYEEFFKQFPVKAEEKCEDKKKHQKNVNDKIKLIEALEWKCQPALELYG